MNCEQSASTNPNIYFCPKCRYHRPNVRKPSNRCSICMDSTFAVKANNPACRGKVLTPLYFEEKKRKKDFYGQLYFRFL